MSEVPSLVSITKATRGVAAGAYIVELKNDCNVQSHMEWMRELELEFSNKPDTCKVECELQPIGTYVVKITRLALDELRRRKDVERIFEDQLIGWDPKAMVPQPVFPRIPSAAHKIIAFGGENSHNWSSIVDPVANIHTQNDAPWGLQRLSCKPPLQDGSDPSELNYTYTYRALETQVVVDVYVFDTGINRDHEEFEGRAQYGINLTTEGDDTECYDANGHGTHVAGIIGGKRVGVAKHANIIAVKVLDDECTSARLIKAISWVVDRAKHSRNPSLINMSLGGSDVGQSLDNVVKLAIADGIHVVVAAGNGAEDAAYITPARVSQAITVGASTIKDELWFDKPGYGSNFGTCVDIFAPGDKITSAGIGSGEQLIQLSGTSMAAAHVAGLIANFLQEDPSLTPPTMISIIQGQGLPDVLANIPKGSRNLLAHCNVSS